MKLLIKLLIIIATLFTSTFLIVKFTGLLTVEQIEDWLIQAKELSPLYVGSIVALLLFADLFIAIPTLTITILAGFFLGHTYGATAALIGTMLAGIIGYAVSSYYGSGIMAFLIKDEKKRREAISAFDKGGFAMILLSRAVPILPEATACLAGMTNMRFRKFMFAWSVSTIPYVLIATYAGSISSVSDPKPAIFSAIIMSSFLWVSWFLYHRFNKNNVD